MTILQQLILEISQAITTYQAEKAQKGEVISDERQQNILALNQLLTINQQNGSDQSAYRLRKRLIDYIEQMPGNWLANWITLLDGSRLRQLLNAVLDQTKFHENELLAQENIELRERQQFMGTAQNGDDLLERLDVLTEEIKKKTQQAMLAMASCDQYQSLCADLGERCQTLINRNRALQTELTELQTTLSEQLHDLKTKVREQDDLIQHLNEANRHLRSEREAECTQAIKIQKKLDAVTVQYKASLERIAYLESRLKAHDIQETELQTFKNTSDAEPVMQFSLEAHS